MAPVPAHPTGGPAAPAGGPAGPEHRPAARSGALRLLEPWFAPFALINGTAVGLTPILLPVVAARYGVGHVGLVMGAFNLGAFAAPLTGSLADRYRAYRALATACAAVAAVSLWLFPLLGPGFQLLFALADGAGFAGAVTIANLLIVERRPEPEWNQRLGWLETALSIGQGAALIMAAWLSGLSARTGLLIGALVPAAAIPLALLLIPRMPAAPRATAPAGTPPPAPDTLAPPAPGPATASPVTPGPPVPGPAASGPPAAGPTVSGPSAAPGQAAPGIAAARANHRLASVGHVGEWGPASPSRAHHLHQRRRPFTGLSHLLGGGFGWLLAAWVPAYAGSAIVFSLYPLLFRDSFGVPPNTSALAFAVIVFLSLPLFIVAGRVSQRHGPAIILAGAMGARVLLLAALAALAAAGHVPVVLPLACFAGILFAWSFLSVAAPGLTGQLRPDAEGDAQGLLNAGSGIAGLAGSVAGGLAASAWGYPVALAIGAGATAVGLAIFLTTVARPHRPAAAP
jgi:MFS family permease